MKTLISTFMLFLFLTPAMASDDPKNMKEVMQRISNDMSKLVNHIMKDEYDEILVLAEKVANHDEPPVSHRLRIIAELGLDFTDFKKNDDEVHINAVAMKKAAINKDTTAIIDNYGKVMQSCNNCHKQYRKRIQALKF